MPYESKAQQRLFFAKENRGELPKGTAKRWAHETKDITSLPEHKKEAAAFGATLGKMAADMASAAKPAMSQSPGAFKPQAGAYAAQRMMPEHLRHLVKPGMGSWMPHPPVQTDPNTFSLGQWEPFGEAKPDVPFAGSPRTRPMDFMQRAPAAPAAPAAKSMDFMQRAPATAAPAPAAKPMGLMQRAPAAAKPMDFMQRAPTK